jgi:Flp pilus assembly protein TadG
MSKENTSMNRKRTGRQSERGQILVLFTLAIVVIIAMLGLVLDGGGSFAQRRNQQNVADFAALAGAAAYINTVGDSATKTAAADTAARGNATANGYTSGANPGEVVDVAVADVGVAVTVTVTVTKPHTNNFAGLVGMPTWGVSATATALASRNPNGAIGVMPLMFNAAAFPAAICDPDVEDCATKIKTYQPPAPGNEDIPQDATQFNWTIFCEGGGAGGCNADSSGVDDLIDNNGTSTVVNMNSQVGPLNAGEHATLYTDISAHVGEEFPVPIVCTVYNTTSDDSYYPCPFDGAMVGFAYFHITSVEGSPERTLKGYFVSPVNGDKLVVVQGGGTSTLNAGTFVLRLTN